MTVPVNNVPRIYVGNGATKIFSGPKAFVASAISVVVDVGGVETTPAFTVSSLGADNSVVTLSTAPANGSTVTISRTTPIQQTSDFTNQQTIQRSVLESTFDQIVMMLQDVAAGVTSAESIAAMIESYAALPADATVRGDLASASLGKGSDMVVVRDTLNRFSGSTLESVLGELELRGRSGVCPEDYGAVGDGVADDSAAINLALAAAAGGVLRFTPGKTYGIASSLFVPSLTTIIAYGATINRISSLVNYMLVNSVTNLDVVNFVGYTANIGITVKGGTWDGGYPTLTSNVLCMGWAHCSRIRVSDAYIKGIAAWHHIEVNSSADVIIDGCTFEGGAEQLDTTIEAIQIDSDEQEVMCSNVTITRCTFNGNGTCIGTHTPRAGKRHNTIRIENNFLGSPYYCGVRADNWESSVITGNTFYRGNKGIWARGDLATSASGLAIANNHFWHIGYGGAYGAVGSGHAIHCSGNSGLTEYVGAFDITGNVIRDLNETNSGSGIRFDYCQGGSVTGNVVNTTTGGHCINIFGGGGIVVSGNRAVAAGTGFKSINVTAALAISILGNQVDTIDYQSMTKSLVMHNNVFVVAGITSSGSNTNTTVKDNLQNTAFA